MGYYEERRKELGLDNNKLGFYERRRIDLGLSPPVFSYDPTVQKKEPVKEPAKSRESLIGSFDKFLPKAETYRIAQKTLETQKPREQRPLYLADDFGEDLSHLPSRDIPVVGTLLKGIDKFSNLWGTKKFAEAAGAGYTPGAGMANVAGLAGATEAAATKLLPKLAGSTLGSKVALGAVREGVTGAPITAVHSAAQGDSATEIAKNTAIGAGVGAGLGAVAPAVGVGIKKALGGIFSKNPEAAKATEELLALPEPKPKMLREGPAPSGDVIHAQGKIADPLALPSPNIAPPTVARKSANPYRVKYENLIKAAKEQNFTPGREYEELQELWGRMAGKTDPNLDELINLAYPKNKVTPNTLEQARTLQAQREVYGIPSKVKTMDERYNTFIGEAQPPLQRMKLRESFQPKVAESSLQSPLKMEPPKISNIEQPLKIEPKKPAMETASPTRKDITKEVDELAKRLDEMNTIGPEDIKDISGFSAHTRDVYRNLEASLGADKAKPYIEGLNAAKNENINMQEYWTNRLKTEVVDKLGITKGSKLSAYVQKFGEKKIDLEQLKREIPNNWEKVVSADKWFREAYDNLIDIVNESRMKIYPNNPDKLVPKRQDYYRHFREMEGLEGLRGIFETPAQISPSLAGLSEFVKPKSKFAGFMQKRGLGKFKNDAVGGFLEYIPSASYSTHIDPQIEVFRSLSKSLSEITDETRSANNLIEYLHDYANSLAGKTNPADRYVQKVIGRRTMGVIRWVNNRVKSNIILGNIGSLLAQLGNVPNGIAAAKQHSIKGLGTTLKSILGESGAISESKFLKERYYNTRQFDTRWFEQPKKLAAWAIETADRVGTEFIWNSLHAQGLAKRVSDPIAYADDLTRKMVAGRGVGETPLLQQSAAYQILAPFTLEVGNAWRVMGDFVKKKDVTALMTLFLTSYMFNKVMEEVRGSGVVFDPIDAVIEASQPGLTPMERVGRVAGEAISNFPLGQQLASIYPENGSNDFGLDLPTRKGLFGDNDPTRFGEGLTMVKGLQDPLFKLAPPFGGNQLKKTILGGMAAFNQGYEKDGKLRFPIDPTPTEFAKSVFFGPGGTSAGRNYYDNNQRPLSEKQTAEYNSLPDDQKAIYYRNIMQERLRSAYQQLQRDQTLSEDERNRRLEEIRREYDKLAVGE